MTEKIREEIEVLIRNQDWYFQHASGDSYYRGKRNFDNLWFLVKTNGPEAYKLFCQHAKGDYSWYRKQYDKGLVK